MEWKHYSAINETSKTNQDNVCIGTEQNVFFFFFSFSYFYKSISLLKKSFQELQSNYTKAKNLPQGNNCLKTNNKKRIVVLKTSSQTIKCSFCSLAMNQAHGLCFFSPLFFSFWCDWFHLIVLEKPIFVFVEHVRR